MDRPFNRRVEASAQRQDGRAPVSRWQALAEEQRACNAERRHRQSWPGFAWPLGLLVYHFMRR